MSWMSFVGTSRHVNFPGVKTCNACLSRTSWSSILELSKQMEGNPTPYVISTSAFWPVIHMAAQVYSPWQRKWLSHLNNNLDLLSEVPMPRANDKSIRVSDKFCKMFDIGVPDVVDGFVCYDRDNMKKYWPAGSDVAYTVRCWRYSYEVANRLC